MLRRLALCSPGTRGDGGREGEKAGGGLPEGPGPATLLQKGPTHPPAPLQAPRPEALQARDTEKGSDSPMRV